MNSECLKRILEMREEAKACEAERNRINNRLDEIALTISYYQFASAVLNKMFTTVFDKGVDSDGSIYCKVNPEYATTGVANAVQELAVKLGYDLVLEDKTYLLSIKKPNAKVNRVPGLER